MAVQRPVRAWNMVSPLVDRGLASPPDRAASRSPGDYGIRGAGSPPWGKPTASHEPAVLAPPPAGGRRGGMRGHRPAPTLPPTLSRLAGEGANKRRLTHW